MDESPDVSCLESPASPGNVFAESLKSNKCVKILMSCLKNLEKEIKELKDLASFKNAEQFKAERQLLDLKDSVDFIFNKFDDLNVTGWKRKKLYKN